MKSKLNSNKNNNSMIVILIILIILCFLLLFSFFMSYQASQYMGQYGMENNYYNNNNNVMGNNMMNNNVGNSQVNGINNIQNNQFNLNGGFSHISQEELNSYLAIQSSAKLVDNNTLLFNESNVKLVVLMGPMEEGKSMYSFVIDNLTNPTLIFQKGASVSAIVVNVDTDAYHSFALTPYGPPYPSMAMMMSYYISTYRLSPQSGNFEAQSISFIVNRDMYYICTVPDHAQKGMFGKILVEG